VSLTLGQNFRVFFLEYTHDVGSSGLQIANTTG